MDINKLMTSFGCATKTGNEKANIEKCLLETIYAFSFGNKIENCFTDLMPSNCIDTISIEKIDFMSMCEHHFLPFFGTIDITYTPNEYIAGIGNFYKVVEKFTRRLQIQERITQQIGDEINQCLKPKCLTVKITAEHFCLKTIALNRSSFVTFYKK